MYNYILVLFLIFSSNLLADLTEKDSLLSSTEIINLYSPEDGEDLEKKNAIKLINEDPLKVIDHLKLGLKKALEDDDNRNAVKAYFLIGSIYSTNLNNLELSIEFETKGLNLARKSKFRKEEGKLLQNIGANYYRAGKLNQATDYFLAAYDILKDYSDSRDFYITVQNLTLLYHTKNDMDSANLFQDELLKYIQRHEGQAVPIYRMLSNLHMSNGDLRSSLKFAQLELKTLSDKNEDIFHGFYSRLAKIYYRMKNYDQALKYYFKALALATGENDHLGMAKYQSNIGNTYLDKYELDSAEFFFDNALAITNNKISSSNLDESLPFKRGLIVINNNLAVISLEKGKYESALKFAQDALDGQNELRLTDFTPKITIIETYLKLNDISKAGYYITDVFNNEELLRKDRQYLRALELKSEYYSKQGNYQEALSIYKDYSLVKDSINKKLSAKTLQKLQVEYNTEIIEQQSKLNEQDKIFTLIVSIIIVLAVLVIAVILYLKFKEKKRAEMELSDKNKEITKNHNELGALYTDLQEKEKKLVESNNSKDKFFSIVAHDLKNPLANMFLKTEMLYTYFEKYSKDQLLSNFKQLHDSSKAASNLVNNILTWARSQSGNIEYIPVDINVYHLLSETLELIGAGAESKDVMLINKVTEDILVYADPNMTDTIFRNLISNAIKFTPRNGTVTIDFEDNIHYWKFIVKDTGIGIKESDIRKLFRIDVHHTTKGTSGETGTGLGLILCKDFVEANDGSIGVESTQGEGTTFWFTLPKAHRLEPEKSK